MKKPPIRLILAIICLAAFLAPAPAAAVPNQKKSNAQQIDSGGSGWSVELGVVTECLWWEPGFRERIMTNPLMDTVAPYFKPFNKSFDMDPSFSVGPMIRVGMPRGFGFSATFLWGGWYEAEASSEQGDPASNHYYTESECGVERWEFDAALDYAINGIFKASVGLLSNGLSMDYKNREYMTPATIPYSYGSREDTLYGVGPSIGMSAKIGLIGPLSLTGGFSLLYLYTSYDAGAYTDVQFIVEPYHTAYHTLGVDTFLALVCSFSSPRITLSLGFRYQYLHYTMWDAQSDGEVRAYLLSLPATDMIDTPDFMNDDDHVYGITLSASYEFVL